MKTEERRVRVSAQPGWDDLVLPESQLAPLRAIVAEDNRASLRGATLALFTGGTGTGKTMATHILGAALGGPLRSLDLESGSLERAAADELLGAARTDRGTLVFDHADLFLRGRARSRPGSGDIDADALLARCQRHNGLVVFTSTSTRGIKEELISQFDYVIDFPFPEADAREKIWRRLLPADATLTDAEVEEIARSFQLPGASIRGCCTVAGSIAEGVETPVQLGHVVAALELEYRDRLANPSTLAALAGLRRQTGIAEQDEPDQADSLPASPRRGLGLGARRLGLGAGLPRLRPEGRMRVARPDARTRRSARPSRSARLSTDRAPRLRRWWPALAVASTLLAAGLGFAAGKATTGQGSQELGGHATAGLFTVSYPSSWHRRRLPARPRLGLGDQLSLAPARSGNPVLVVGSSPAAPPSFLPQGVVGALPSVPVPQVVRLGALGFYRYPRLSVPGDARPETLYVLPTTAGTIVADCAPGSASGFVASCERALASLRLVAATALPLAPSPTYAFALNRIINGLNAVRVSAGAQLAAATDPGVIVDAAGRLASADAAAAASLQTLPAGVASVPNAALAAALNQGATAYRALARAELRGSSAGYDAAKASAGRAQAAADTAYEELFQLGYRLS